MTEDQLRNFLSSVEAKTASGALIWERTPEEDCFQATISGYVLRIATEFDPDHPNDPDYVLRILNTDNELIEAIYRWSFKEPRISFNPHQALKAVHVNARRSAMGADEAVSAIAKALDELGS